MRAGTKKVSDKIVDRLARGVALDDGPAKFDAIERIGGTEDGEHDWFRVLLRKAATAKCAGCGNRRAAKSRASKRDPLLVRQTAAAAAARLAQELPGERVEALRRESTQERDRRRR